jgi:hypothetical protein
MKEEIQQEHERLIEELKNARIQLQYAELEYDNAFTELEEFKAKYREKLDE